VIFVDTSFFFAGLEPRDPRHEVAMEIGRRLSAEHLVTTNHVRGETWTLVRRKHGHHRAVGFLNALDRSEAMKVATVDEATERLALSWLRLHDEREYSFVDATSFAFMQENRISEALTFDGDFSAAGFVELRP